MRENILGERIKKRRKELGMTQQELAYKLGIATKQTISQVENGRDSNLSADRITKFAKALNTTEAYLMGWDDVTKLDYIISSADMQILLEVAKSSKKEHLLQYARKLHELLEMENGESKV